MINFRTLAAIAIAIATGTVANALTCQQQAKAMYDGDIRSCDTIGSFGPNNCKRCVYGNTIWPNGARENGCGFQYETGNGNEWNCYQRFLRQRNSQIQQCYQQASNVYEVRWNNCHRTN